MTKTVTISTTTTDDTKDEDLIHTKTIFRRHSKGPVMFNGCSPSGDLIIIENISTSKQYDLTGWYIERETDTQAMLRYRFPPNFLLSPLTTVELWSSTATPVPISAETQEQQQQQTFVSIKTKVSSWHSARLWSTTRLFDQTRRERATFAHRTLPAIEKEKNE